MTRPGRARGRFDDRVMVMARVLDLHEKWMEKPAYREAYEALEEEFALAAAAIDANGAQENCP